MTTELKVKIGKKSDRKPAKLSPAQKPGPLKPGEVEGQSGWIMVQCPWCGGVNRVFNSLETVDPGGGMCACSWCGNTLAY